MSLDCNRFASPSPLPWINLVGASSIAIFWTLVGINIKPVQANSPEPQVTPTAVPAPTGLTIPPATNSQELQQALAKEQALPVTKETLTQPSITQASVVPPQTAALAVKPEAAVERVAEVGQAVTEDKAQEELERSLVANPNCADTTCSHWVSSAKAVRPPSANPKLAQLPYPIPTSNPLPVPTTPIPGGFGSSNSTLGQLPSLPQPQSAVPVPPPALPGGFNNYPQMGGQQAYYPQMMMLVPVPQQGMAPPPNGYPQMGQPAYYPQMGGQQAYYPQMMMLIPVPQQGMAPPPNGYPQMRQPTYYPQAVQPLPPPLAPNQPSFNGYPQMGQPAYYQQAVPIAPNQPGFNNYPQQIGQSPYYQQAMPIAPNQPGFNNYPQVGQSPYYPQAVPIAPSQPGFNNYPQVGQSPYYPQAVPIAPNQPGFNNYPQVGQSPYYPQALPLSPNPNLAPPAPTPTVAPLNQQQPLLRSTALTSPVLQLQGTYINQGDQSSARARLAALYPLTPQVQFGASLDLTSEANSFADSRGQGLNVNELYVAAAPFTGLPNLRFVAGQLDLTSYFDRNSFAKDGASQFFNPVFQTNPALSATGIASRPGVLVNWTLTDNIEAKAAVFSSSRSLSDFSLDAFAGEIGFRYGNAIVRGTFTSDRDAGSRDGFREIFGVTRPDGTTGIRSSDREDAYGVNGEYFFPDLNMGLFARYGRYENQSLKSGGDTYSFGVSFLDLITKDDRLGLAYGRNLSNDLLRSLSKSDVPDVLELFYDFRFLPNLRLGFTLQQRNGFEDTYAGFRVRSDFDVTPRGRLTP